MAERPVYAPLPARAMVDMRLSERHLRTLAVVAAHDRLGKNGIGCWASHKRLAEMVGCHYTRISHNLKELGEMGYIERVEHPLNKRLRVYRVLYTDVDAKAMKATAKLIANDGSCPDGQVSDDPIVAQSGKPDPDIVARLDNSGADIVAHHNQEATGSVQEPPVNIFPEGGNISRETLEIDSAEAARPGGRALSCEAERGLSTDTSLAILEQSIKRMKKTPEPGDVHILKRYGEWLARVADEHPASGDGNPTGGRAERLLEEVESMLKDHYDEVL